jgi:DNA-directed RNA polymerase specialized sigma24 family protein
MDELIKYVRALVYLQAHQMSGEARAVKSEVLLAEAGLSYKEIAGILGKKELAIAKSLSRARATKKGKINE